VGLKRKKGEKCCLCQQGEGGATRGGGGKERGSRPRGKKEGREKTLTVGLGCGVGRVSSLPGPGSGQGNQINNPYLPSRQWGEDGEESSKCEPHLLVLG